MYKKTFLLLLPLIGATQLAAKQDPVLVPILDQQSTSNPLPRTPSKICIECVYDLSSEIIATSLSGVTGTTEVVWENLDTGESYDEELIGSGVFYLPFSCSFGLWRITFTLQNGAIYWDTCKFPCLI